MLSLVCVTTFHAVACVCVTTTEFTDKATSQNVRLLGCVCYHYHLPLENALPFMVVMASGVLEQTCKDSFSLFDF